MKSFDDCYHIFILLLCMNNDARETNVKKIIAYFSLFYHQSVITSKECMILTAKYNSWDLR